MEVLKNASSVLSLAMMARPMARKLAGSRLVRSEMSFTFFLPFFNKLSIFRPRLYDQFFLINDLILPGYLEAGRCNPNCPMLWTSQGCFLCAPRCTKGASSPMGPTARALRALAPLVAKESMSGLTLGCMSVPLTRSFVERLTARDF